MTGFKQREKDMTDKLIQSLLDAFELEEILDFNDIPDAVVLESLIENDYLSDDDLIDQLMDNGVLDEEVSE